MEYGPIHDSFSTHELNTEAWKYEAIRITSAITATAIIRTIPMSEAVEPVASTMTSAYTSDYFENPFVDLSVSTSQIATPSSSTFPTTSSRQQSPFKGSLEDYLGEPTPAEEVVGGEPRYILPESLYIPFSSATGMHSSVSFVTTSYPSVFSGSSHTTGFSATSHFEYAHMSDSKPFTSVPESSNTVAMLKDLKKAITNSGVSDCWSDMGGVLLWIGLTAGAASRELESRELRNWFAAIPVRVCMVLGFDHPAAICSATLNMSRIVEALLDDHKSQVVHQGREEANKPDKRRKMG